MSDEPVPWRLVCPDAAGVAESAGRVAVAPETAFRAVPLLEIAHAGDHRLVVVGQTQVWTASGSAPLVTVVVRALWTATEAPGADGVRGYAPPLIGWTSVPDDPALEQAIARLVAVAPADASGDDEARATAMAKWFAEGSRNAVAELRTARHGLERLLANEIRHGSTKQLEVSLADILELSIAASHARDEAREAVREGLWTWRSDGPAYHAQRRLLDPTLPPRPGSERGSERAWFGTLDAAVRQCQAMEQQLGHETDVLHSLLNATSTIAVTRDARAQELFNLVASVGGILLGVPALVLSLYGATTILPLRFTNYVVLVPLLVGGLLAALIAAYLPGKERTGKLRRFVATLVAVLVTVLILMLAGALVTPHG